MHRQILTAARWTALSHRPKRVKPIALPPILPTAVVAIDVMGYHDAREIPNYWALAKYFVLQDHLFEPNASWSLPQHLFMVSEWSAKCSKAGDPMSCINELQSPADPPDFAPNLNLPNPDYAWTDLTYLLFKNQVAWKYYIQTGTSTRLRQRCRGLPACPPECQDARDMESPALL
jgi:phospholipase C